MLEKIWPNELTTFIIDIIKNNEMCYEDIDIDYDPEEDFWCTREELEKYLKDNMNYEAQKWGEWKWEEYYVVWKLSNWDYIKVDSTYNSWDSNQFENVYKCYQTVDGWWSKNPPKQEEADLFLSKVICRIKDLWLEVKESSSYIQTSENQTT